MAALAVLTTCAATAEASFILTRLDLPGGLSSETPPSNEGADPAVLGGTLAIIDAGAGDSIAVHFFAAEPGFRNEFNFNDATPLDSPENLGWSQRSLGTRGASDGAINFRFCAMTMGECLTQAQNDASRLGSLQSIGMWLRADLDTAWLLRDDPRAAGTQDHDGLIVRLAYRSVPEPGTLALLGLGLLGVDFARRKTADAGARTATSGRLQ